MAAQIPHALARATTRGVRWLGACEAQEMTSEIRHAHPITQTTRAEALQLRLSATLETQPRNPKERAPRRANKIPEPMEPTFYSGSKIPLLQRLTWTKQVRACRQGEARRGRNLLGGHPGKSRKVSLPRWWNRFLCSNKL